jgi:hypothetical protein
MSGDLTSAYNQMVTNDFVNDLKSLSIDQTENAYSVTIQHLLIQLKNATPNGLMENLPFAVTVIDNFYRVIPIFDQKLSKENENSRQTNLFLETLSNTYDGLCLFDLFLAIKDTSCLEIIFRRYIPLIKQKYFTNDNKYDHLVNCLLPIISYSSVLIPVSENNLPSNFLTSLLEFTKNNWQRKERTTIINNVLGLMKVFSKTPTLVPMIIRCGWPNECIQWLKKPGPRPSYKTDFLICLILQKLSRHAIGVEALNQLNCIKALEESKEQMKKGHNKQEYQTINFIQCITYALLVEADEIKRNSIVADALVCHVLDQIVLFIFQASKNESLIYEGCHISEVLCVLSKLFVNDDILRKCLRENSELFECLCQLLVQLATIANNDIARTQKLYRDEALIILTNLLWSISFHESYHEKFRSNAKLMQTLSNLATSSLLYTNTQVQLIPYDLASLKKAAEAILWNLKSSHLHLSKEKSERPLVMISYSHSDSTFCRELVEHLSRHIPVWVDYKQAHHSVNHSDDLWEEIAGAMEMATAIVLIISKEYYDSKACRQELSYASDTLKKRIIPVYLPNQQYRANGWLGIRIAGQKYVHFGRKPFPDAFNELLSIIKVDQKSTIVPESSHQMIPTKMNEPENPLKNWTSKDIRKWFDDNHIHQDFITLFTDQFHTGTALLVYAHHLKQFYRNEYIQILANYQKAFNGKRLQTLDFVTFVDALWRLREEYDPQSKIQDALDNCGANQLSYTMKILGEGITRF